MRARDSRCSGFRATSSVQQEPGSAEEIASFCSLTYGVTFPMFEKIEVNGPDRNPLYAELTTVADAKGKAGDVEWNFEKFVVSPDGAIVARFRPKTAPDAPDVVALIESLLPRGRRILTRLLGARTAVIADVAPDGRELLVRCDDTGSLQVYRLQADGRDLVQLTFLAEPVSAARYIPGTDDIVVAVDHGGNEVYQLWLVDRSGGEPRALIVEDTSSTISATSAATATSLRSRRRSATASTSTCTSSTAVTAGSAACSRAAGIGRVLLARWTLARRQPPRHDVRASATTSMVVDVKSAETSMVVTRTGPGSAIAPTWYPDSSAFLSVRTPAATLPPSRGMTSPRRRGITSWRQRGTARRCSAVTAGLC